MPLLELVTLRSTTLRPGAKPPQDAVDDPTMILPLPATLPVAGQQRLNTAHAASVRVALAACNSPMTAAWTATVASGSGEGIAASRTTSTQASLLMGRAAQDTSSRPPVNRPPPS